ncbi:MAG: SpoIIE family protein phosphatase [Erysipelotrichaceae bacterium]|nr:SpoIIE family protein phosphatase [Erysipelotrichaceae bacterium]
MFKVKSLGQKISMVMVGVIIVTLLIVGVIFMLSMKDVSDVVISTNKEVGESVTAISSTSMTEVSKQRLVELAHDKASIADGFFIDFERAVRIVAADAERIYGNPNRYVQKTVRPPKKENNGKLSLQVLYSDNVNPNDSRIVHELGLLGNIGDTLMSVNSQFDDLASIYVATESGFMVQADYIAASKFDDAGNIMPLDARRRPWYIGARESGEPYFTPVVRDAHTPQLGIMCGVPVYKDGKLVAVAGGGMYLDALESLVKNVDLGASGNSCILNRKGQVLFSTYSEGTLAAVDGGPDLRTLDGSIAEIATDAVNGATGIAMLEIDGADQYVAYAPLKTVGWSVFVILSQVSVEEPTAMMREKLSDLTQQAIGNTNLLIGHSLVMMVSVFACALAFALANSMVLSKKIVKPIKALTEEVQAIEGDNLDFKWDMNTDDETQVLADSFRSLTERMKMYINDIQLYTAKNERMSAELSLAERIQASMLPHENPPFPDKKEFEIFGVMDPAREVGGDFYDYFFIDDDHLCLTIADVSGKGIPGALFMMISVIILRNTAMMIKKCDRVLAQLNEALCSHNEAEMFLTVWIGILEISTGKLTACNAGHEYPMIKHPDGNYEMLKDKHGLVLGAMQHMKYTEYEIYLEPGSKVFVYTDGLPEATNKDEKMFGTDRVVETLNVDPNVSPEQTLQNMRKAVDEFVQDAEQFDDLTMLCIEYRGKQK